MTREENIRAILECNLNGFKDEIIDIAVKNILNIKDEHCGDCVDRKAVLDKIKEVCFSREQKWVDFRVSQGSNGQRDLIINFIKDLPPVTPTRGHGEWVSDEFGCIYSCNKCDCVMPENGAHDFCPNCGADMRKAESEDVCD